MSNLIRSTSTTRLAWCLARRGLPLEDLAYGPLVGREPFSASCNRCTNESLETEKYGVYSKEYPANCPLRWRLSNVMGCISMIASWIWSPYEEFYQVISTSEMSYNPVVGHPLAARPVFMDDNHRPHRSSPVTVYLQSKA